MEIIPEVHHISEAKGANVYLLLGRTLTLVDTGMPGNEEAILDYVSRLGRSPTELSDVILTHYHIDHIGSTAEIRQATPARVSAHPADAPFVSGERPQPPPRGAILRLLHRFVPAMSRFDPVAVDIALNDGDPMDVLAGATVLHAPGHTPGSIALHFPSERLLLCGDAINRRANRLGPPFKPFTADMEQAIASLRRLAELDFDVLGTGHGAPITGGAQEQVRALARELA